MATAEDRFLRRMFVGLVVFTFVFVIITSAYPATFKLILTKIGEWIFTYLPVGRIIMATVFAFWGIVILGSLAVIYEKFIA
jgi:hypothetical protein